VALQIKKLQRQLLRNTRALQNSVVQKEEARAEVAMSAKNKATIKNYKGKTTKKGRATKKATADFQETANTANMALVQYQNKEVIPTAAHKEDKHEQDMWKVLNHRLGNNGSAELQVNTCDTSDEDRVNLPIVLRYTPVFYLMERMEQKLTTGRSAGMPFVVAAGKQG
jgi:predicted HNH restriction endonuclease